MNDIEIIYFKPLNRAGRERNNTDGIDIIRDIRDNSRSILYQVRLNHRLAEDIKRVGCTHTCMGYNRLTGEYYIAFNRDEKGLALVRHKSGGVAYINSKSMVEYICNAFGFTGTGRWHLKTSDNLSKNADSITIKIELDK